MSKCETEAVEATLTSWPRDILYAGWIVAVIKLNWKHRGGVNCSIWYLVVGVTAMVFSSD